MKHLLLIASATLAFAACATVQHGPMQKIAVESEPAGAVVQTDQCGPGSTKEAATPAVVWVSRRAERCTLTFLARGYETERVTLRRALADEFFENAALADIACSSGDCIDLDFLFLATLFTGTGMVVDTATGALFEQRPNAVFVEMVAVDER